MKMLLSILVCSSIVSAQLTPLDSLLARSARSKTLASEQFGFKHVELTPPAQLFNVLPPLPPLPTVNQYITVHEYDKDMANVQASISKMTTIMENLQAQSDSHRNNLDIVIKIIEALVGLIGAVSTLIIAFYGIKKSKKK